MMTPTPTEESRSATVDRLQAQNAELHRRLEEADETIRAIRQGAVDAFVVEDLPSYRIYTLEGADGPYRLFVEQMQQGVATLHPDGTIVYCNRRLAELLQVPHERVMGAQLYDFVLLADRPVYDELLSEAQSSRPVRGEARLRRPDGGLVPVSLAFDALPKDSGALIGVLVTDLTLVKRQEQLMAAQEALQETDRRRTEFLAMLAHELRNPLAPMLNAVDILRLATDDTAAVRSTCEMLQRQVGQMVRLVDNLLDVSRISQGKVQLHKERVELATILDRAVESTRPLCASLGHELTVRLPPTPVYIDGDPVRLTQVFANLLDNACKYMEKGGRVLLSAEVSASEHTSRREVAVRVKDGGIGIAADELTRIFDMFTQVNTSLERTRSGLGIGLTLAKSLVEMHGGRVEAHSGGHGHGSEFVVHLPILVEPGGSPRRRRRRVRRRRPVTESSSSTTVKTPPTRWPCC